MSKRFFIVILALAIILTLISGCVKTSNASDSSVSDNENAVLYETPTPAITAATETAASGANSGAIDSMSAFDGSPSYVIEQDGKSVSVSLGMTYDEITARLKDAGITYVDSDCYSLTDDGKEQSIVTFPGSQKNEYLSFSKDEQPKLADIRWTEARGDESSFPNLVVSEIKKYNYLPLYYHSGAGNDGFVFPLSGGYYLLSLDYETEDKGDGEVTSMFSRENGGEPSSDTAYLLGEDTSLASLAGKEDIADLKTVMEQVKNKYGETDGEGLIQSYSYEGIALYNQELYYSIQWSQLVPDDDSGGGHSSYNGQIYVSIDGNKILTGYFSEVDAS